VDDHDGADCLRERLHAGKQPEHDPLLAVEDDRGGDGEAGAAAAVLAGCGFSSARERPAGAAAG